MDLTSFSTQLTAVTIQRDRLPLLEQETLEIPSEMDAFLSYSKEWGEMIINISLEVNVYRNFNAMFSIYKYSSEPHMVKILLKL